MQKPATDQNATSTQVLTKRLDALSRYFTGGESESEREIWHKIFVPPVNMQEMLDFSLERHHIVLGPKGSGKSLLVDNLRERLAANGKIALTVRPDVLDLEAVSRHSVDSEKVKEAKRQLYDFIAAEIGKGIGEATTDNLRYLKSLAGVAGSTHNDWKKYGRLFAEMLPENYGRILQALVTYNDIDTEKYSSSDEVATFFQADTSPLVLLLDDIDAGVESDAGDFKYSTAWALLEAAVQITHDLSSAVAIVMMRTDIWYTMTEIHQLGSSIMDKLGQRLHLRVNEDWIGRVFERRISECYRVAVGNSKPTYEVGYFFTPEQVTLGARNQRSRSWTQFIAKNSRNRPRDMIHLMQALIRATKLTNSDRDTKIADRIVPGLLRDFAEKRVEFIRKEYSQMFPKIDEVVMRLDRTRYTFSDIRDFLKRMCGIGLKIDGKPIRETEPEAYFRILQVLHMASVINPREEIGEQGYQHILFEDQPSLLNPNRYQTFQNYVFEVHPTFHALIAERSH